jgi:arylsulfatase A-like enzyme
LQWPGAEAGDFQDAEEAGAARAEFAGEVGELDANFGRWLDERQDVLGDDTLLVVTARSGAALFPHPSVARGCPAIVDPIVRVPLIVHAGRNEQCGTRRRGLVSAVDLEATLEEWFGIDGGREEGRSLLPVLRGEVEQVRDAVQFSCEGAGRGVRTERFSCLCPAGMELPVAGAGWDFSGPNRPWLFTKPEDVWDMLDVAAQYPDEVDRLVRLMYLEP